MMDNRIKIDRDKFKSLFNKYKWQIHILNDELDFLTFSLIKIDDKLLDDKEFKDVPLEEGFSLIENANPLDMGLTGITSMELINKTLNNNSPIAEDLKLLDELVNDINNQISSISKKFIDSLKEK